MRGGAGIAVGIVGVLIGAFVAAAGVLYAEDRVERRVEVGLAEARAAFISDFRAEIARIESQIDTLRHRFEGIDDLKTAQEQALRRYRNPEHLAAARRLGVGVPAGRDAVERLASDGSLVRLNDNRYYQVKELSMSVPYVTVDMSKALEELGRRMQDQLAEYGLPPFRFVISSVLRTGDDQARLRRVNPNAARGESAHAYGTTVDIVYHTYDHVPRPQERATPARDALFDSWYERSIDGLAMLYWQELQGVLGRVLIEMQREGKVLVTLEREQPVFHITVNARYPDT